KSGATGASTMRCRRRPDGIRTTNVSEWSRFSSCLALVVTLLAFAAAAFAQAPDYQNVGKAATKGEIEAWDISVGPEGKELPPGKGTAKEGAPIYAAKCASCHGAALEGSKAVPALVGGQGTFTTIHIKRSIGSYWPFATTIWDYINRAMPPQRESDWKADDV